MGALALSLLFAELAVAAPPKAAAPAAAPAPAPAPAGPTWIADELRILRSDVDALKQRSDTSASDVGALRADLTKLTNTLAEMERRLGNATPIPATSPVAAPDHVGNGGVAAAAVFLTLGAALGWVGSRLTQRWRDRRQRIRV
jgi:hypothetical protein